MGLMDPNELLIFKERMERGEEKKAEPQKAEEKRAQAKPAPAAKPKHERDMLDDLRSKIEAHEAKAARAKAEKEQAKAAVSEERRKEAEEARAKKAEIGFEAHRPKQARETKSEVIARESASGLNCIWHPWRQAYAICSYCHRAFCFEDIVAERGNYYCLEDMDTAIRSRMETASNKSSNVSVIAGGAYLIPVIVFIYSYNAALASAVSYIAAIGFIPFVYNPVYQYAFPLIGGAATMLSFMLGLWLFAGSRKVFPGLAIGATTSAIFIYDYLSSASLYDLVIGLTSLAALMLFVYSLSIYIPAADDVIVPREEDIVPQWSNVGRF